MGDRVSVIIPARNEASVLGATIDAARAAGAAEVIVADGGSTDDTVAVALAREARLVTGESMRALQLNRGADAARHDVLLFLHADTLLPPGACDRAAAALAGGACFGGFRLAFVEPSVRLRLAAALINLRTAITKQPWGDQAQFVTRDRFLPAGGFRAIPLMEDYELARRMKRAGPVAILPMKVRTSGRRFLARGLIRTTLTNWTIVTAWHLGVNPDRLAKWYRT